MILIQTIVAGGGWRCGVKLKNPDGTAMDLTGATVFFVIKLREDDEAELVFKAITDHTDAEGGVTLIELSAEETEGLSPGHEHVAQIRVKDSEGFVQPWPLMGVQVDKLLSDREE